MKLRHWILGASSCLFVAAIAAAGCGGSESSGPAATTDGGNDAVIDNSVQDVVADKPVETGPTCTKDADFTQLQVPDASLADGGTNTGACVACVKSGCSAEANACAADCECNNAVLDFFTCVGQGKSILTCGAGLLSLPASSRALGQALGACVIQDCSQQCGVPNLDGGSDAPTEGG